MADAELLFRQCLDEEPDNLAALYSLGVIRLNRGELAQAVELFDRGLAIAPEAAPFWSARGAALQSSGDYQNALLSFDKALEINPDFIEVLINSGALLREVNRHHESLQRFQRVLAINPDNESALCNAGILLTEYKQSELAISMFDRLLKINPQYTYGLGLLCYERMHSCDWTDFDQTAKKIVEGIRKARRTCKTLALMAITDSVSDHFLAARIFARHWLPDGHPPLWSGERYKHDRIRVAYVSADLREHPVGHLAAGIFERHDKSRFEVIAISLGIDDQSRLRGRMKNAFDQFHDVKGQGSRQIAGLMRKLEVDIAVDLGGYTSDARTEIFCHRPAPMHVNFLGYPGTLGTRHMDYIIADPHTIPEGHQPFFSEQVVYLPDTYMPTASGISISERTPTREECGLPEGGIVFCAFSHDHKISPAIFDVWMRVLRQVPGSTLWLMSRGELAMKNLRISAEVRGVRPDRLVFATRVPMVEDHLARYRLADMFLDTFPYNAHTTAADALLVGLPVVTCMGDAFPARVAGSLLHSCDLGELATHSLDDYEGLVLKLATEPDSLAEIRARLVSGRAQHPLFDVDKFCKNLEAAYVSMWQKHQADRVHDAT